MGNKVSVFVCLLSLLATTSAQRRRNEKSLANTFPFSGRAHDNDHDHDHDHGHDHEVEDEPIDNYSSPISPSTPIRDPRQGGKKNDISLDIGSIAAAGERCIDKVVFETCFHAFYLPYNKYDLEILALRTKIKRFSCNFKK